MAKRRFDNEDENVNNFESDSESERIEDEGDSEDLFGENYEDDYRSLADLDTYDISENNTEDAMSYSEMQRIEHELDGLSTTKAESISVNVNLEDVDGTKITKDFIKKEFYTLKIANWFCNFLQTFGNKKYVKAIRRMCSDNEESLYVSYFDLEKDDNTIVTLLINNTEDILRCFDAGLEKAVKVYFQNYNLIKSKLHARIIDLPVLESIRNLRNSHLNSLVKINGIVTRRSSLLPLISIVKFSCLKCNSTFGPFTVEDDNFKPSTCFECQSRGPFKVNSQETIYKDYQKLTIQEIPGTVAAGNLPRNIEVYCYFDLIDKGKPGDEVEVIGVFKNNFSLNLNMKNSFPVFFTAIEAVSITNKESEFSSLKITDEDVKEIVRLSKKSDISKIIFRSIAPSIFGHHEIKKSIAVALFGGERRVLEDHIVRGDINLLLLGDPGTAKSQFLRYVQNLMHKAVLATGQGASSVGLTASVQKDPVTKEWTLEGGAMVLADKGICLIDEFDKMNDTDRTSIHEAMEQQTVSISKAGIVTSLNARCGVIAAANPIRGRYNSSLTFNQNVNLSEPIISRFDLLCVVKDVIEIKNDERMAKFILGNHEMEDNIESEGEMISQDLLKKYIIYVRSNVHPTLKDVDLEKISRLYSQIRRESMGSGSIPITVRHVESIIRISESFAKMRLSNEVSSSDVDNAIQLTLDSFINAQKFGVMKSLRRKFSKFLLKEDSDGLILYILSEMFNEKLLWKDPSQLYVLKHDFEKIVKSNGFVVPSGFYGVEKLKKSGYRMDPRSNLIYREAN